MVLAFTGTRQGLTKKQTENLKNFLERGKKKIKLCLHGDCLGADEQFHNLVRNILDCQIWSYWVPGKWNAEKHKDSDKNFKRKNYLQRNREMVVHADLIIGFPKENKIANRGGTWYTISYAKVYDKRVGIFYPDGRIYVE